MREPNHQCALATAVERNVIREFIANLVGREFELNVIDGKRSNAQHRRQDVCVFAIRMRGHLKERWHIDGARLTRARRRIRMHVTHNAFEKMSRHQWLFHRRS